MKKIKNIILPVSLFFLFMLQACNNKGKLTYGDFDLNNDYLVKIDEFKQVFPKNYYNIWDSNDDQKINNEDFFITIYKIWDIDNDQALSKEEYIKGFDYHYGNYIVEDFVAIDKNQDNNLTYAEFYDALYQTAFYNDWNLDDDAMISENELALNVFARWDYDNSGSIDLDEFSDFDSYYLQI